MLSLSSAICSGEVSATVSRSREDPSRLSKNRRPPAQVITMSQEYTERGVHMSVVSRVSVMNTCAFSSCAYFLRYEWIQLSAAISSGCVGLPQIALEKSPPQ